MYPRKLSRREFIPLASGLVLVGGGCMHGESSRPVNEVKVTVDLPLFDELWKLDGEIKQQFASKRNNGIEALGVTFRNPDQLTHGGYSCTPTNTVAFASTGGDGVHFSFLVRDDRVGVNSPVVLTAPSNFGNENCILAENFRTFLRMGLRRGYFAMEQLSYSPTEALHVYGTPDWKPSSKSDHSKGYVLDDREVRVLQFVAKRLQLEPFSCTPEDFQAMQDRYMQVLKIQS
ncbi:hypothetical protein [Anatilimnocola floriformis]|uniref:hypothetical protein n=1 Tax=Anatilimnocola floriformis TaxID=2948575 RepID=UPI0020C2B841|nr:hypothetical protein [Anatilimnocola floriformis]